jgi:hypothetical protein
VLTFRNGHRQLASDQAGKQRHLLAAVGRPLPRHVGALVPAEDGSARLEEASVLDALDELNLAYPKVDAQKKKELEAARKRLLKSKQD